MAAELNEDGTEDPVEVFPLRACSRKRIEAPPTLPMVSRGALRVQEGNFEYMEFTWFDKKEDNVDKDVVFSGQ